MRVEEFKSQKIGIITRTRPTTVSENELMSQALIKIHADANHVLAVINGERKIIGIVSWSDVLGKSASNKTLKEENAIVDNPITIESSETVDTAVQKMNAHNLNKLIVVDDENRPVGIITKKDVRNQFSKSFKVAL